MGFFKFYSLYEDMICFYKYLLYSTSSVQKKEKPLEQTRHADKYREQRFDNV